MKEHETDDTISMVLSDMQTSVPESFRAAIAGVRAPLAKIIDELLRQQPGIRFYDALSAIASLNQGRLKDLDSPIFRSYIIRKTDISDDVLHKCISEICGFNHLVQAANNPMAGLLMAARDEDNSGGGHILIDEVLGQLAKRTK